MKKVFLGLGLMSVFLIGCGVSQQEKEQLEAIKKQTKEIMSVHDEVMPRMDELHALTKKIDLIILELDSDTSSIVQQKKVKAEEVIKSLQSADQGMMSWMRDWKFPKEGTPIEKTMTYLEEQSISVNKMASEMKEAIEKAETFIKDNKIEK